MDQAVIDNANENFWNELCGTGLAKHLGIQDHSQESLQKFDNFYFELYPYLLPFIKPERMNGKRILEIGLGYGSLSQKLAEAGVVYQGLDIAPNAAAMANHRLTMQGFAGHATVGSALAMPFLDETFDFVISIGCFHHTGNTQRCLDETFRVLKPGGEAILMVYNKFSFRQWRFWPKQTFRDLFQIHRTRKRLEDDRRKAYDANLDGTPAPETQLLSISDLRAMLHRFESVRFQKQNADDLYFKKRLLFERKKLLSSLGRFLGLDIYFRAIKPMAARSILKRAA